MNAAPSAAARRNTRMESWYAEAISPKPKRCCRSVSSPGGKRAARAPSSNSARNMRSAKKRPSRASTQSVALIKFWKRIAAFTSIAEPLALLSSAKIAMRSTSPCRQHSPHNSSAISASQEARDGPSASGTSSMSHRLCTTTTRKFSSTGFNSSRFGGGRGICSVWPVESSLPNTALLTLIRHPCRISLPPSSCTAPSTAASFWNVISASPLSCPSLARYSFTRDTGPTLPKCFSTSAHVTSYGRPVT
mmetsp:Transcript_73843/g.123362  ORF Transcript_73843/g.123362 Transcript_73843/m.123362 type:complete len:248 (-) Transcript_73843:846-1589(-)